MSDRPNSHLTGWTEPALRSHLTAVNWRKRDLVEHLRESHPAVKAVGGGYAVSTIISTYPLALLQQWHEVEHENSLPTCPVCDAPLTHVGATCPDARLSAHRAYEDH